MSFLIDAKLFASNVRYYREHRSYTVKELAEHSDLTPMVIQTLESGIQIPTEGQLSSIARALMVKPEELVLPRPPEVAYYESC